MPETVGQADFKYQTAMDMFNEGQQLDRQTKTGYMDVEQEFYQNYFRYVAAYVKEYTWFDVPEGGDTLKRNI